MCGVLLFKLLSLRLSQRLKKLKVRREGGLIWGKTLVSVSGVDTNPVTDICRCSSSLSEKTGGQLTANILFIQNLQKPTECNLSPFTLHQQAPHAWADAGVFPRAVCQLDCVPMTTFFPNILMLTEFFPLFFACSIWWKTKNINNCVVYRTTVFRNNLKKPLVFSRAELRWW